MPIKNDYIAAIIKTGTYINGESKESSNRTTQICSIDIDKGTKTITQKTFLTNDAGAIGNLSIGRKWIVT